MTKLTIDSSPSKEIVNNANQVHQVVDENGRLLGVKVPTFQDNVKYDLHFGKFEQSNKKFYETTKFILFIKSIDEFPVAFPKTENEVIALAGRLGEEGISAILNKILEINEKKATVSEEEEKETLKK